MRGACADQRDKARAVFGPCPPAIRPTRIARHDESGEGATEHGILMAIEPVLARLGPALRLAVVLFCWRQRLIPVSLNSGIVIVLVIRPTLASLILVCVVTNPLHPWRRLQHLPHTSPRIRKKRSYENSSAQNVHSGNCLPATLQPHHNAGTDPRSSTCLFRLHWLLGFKLLPINVADVSAK